MMRIIRAVGSVNIIPADFNPLVVASSISKSAIGTAYIIGSIECVELRLSLFILLLNQRIEIRC
ncbi:MAG: hypothetical protein ACKVOQ_18855 [Cyclobacteriaceae bacterium]